VSPGICGPCWKIWRQVWQPNYKAKTNAHLEGGYRLSRHSQTPRREVRPEPQSQSERHPTTHHDHQHSHRRPYRPRLHGQRNIPPTGPCSGWWPAKHPAWHCRSRGQRQVYQLGSPAGRLYSHSHRRPGHCSVFHSQDSHRHNLPEDSCLRRTDHHLISLVRILGVQLQSAAVV
jgi:hypothetical protein